MYLLDWRTRLTNNGTVMNERVLIAFGLTLVAGLGTGIGSLAAFFARKTDKVFMSAMLGFSAGVMIYISFVEILPQAGTILASAQGPGKGTWLTAISFFGGLLVMMAIDMLLPAHQNPHEAHLIEELAKPKSMQMNLLRMGGMTAVAITIHNFPEGIATFAVSLQSVSMGLPIAVAIALHNIPEGISVAVPIFYATGDRRKACIVSALTGLAEPAGAVVAYFLLRNLLGAPTVGILLACVAGIMVYVALDELLPTAKKYDTGHASIFGVVAGMAVMALSLLIMR